LEAGATGEDAGDEDLPSTDDHIPHVSEVVAGVVADLTVAGVVTETRVAVVVLVPSDELHTAHDSEPSLLLVEVPVATTGVELGVVATEEEVHSAHDSDLSLLEVEVPVADTGDVLGVVALIGVVCELLLESHSAHDCVDDEV